MAFWAACSTPLCLEVRSPLLKKKKNNRAYNRKEKIPTAAPILIPDVEQVEIKARQGAAAFAQQPWRSCRPPR